MKEVNPQEAYEAMQADPKCIYLDVRSVPEFEAGHAKGAINIPIMHMTPGIGMSPNEDFAAVAATTLSKDVRIVIGCKTGGRSARATEILNQMGYADATNIRGGFVGMMDNFGTIVEPGWSMLNLPVCSECGPEDSYDALSARHRSD